MILHMCVIMRVVATPMLLLFLVERLWLVRSTRVHNGLQARPGAVRGMQALHQRAVSRWPHDRPSPHLHPNFKHVFTTWSLVIVLSGSQVLKGLHTGLVAEGPQLTMLSGSSPPQLQLCNTSEHVQAFHVFSDSQSISFHLQHAA
jgi:hypothetical protein